MQIAICAGQIKPSTPKSRNTIRSTISFATRSVRSKKSIKMKIETLAVHAGHSIDPATGAVSSPIYLSTTFERDAEGTYSRGFMYTRNNNPNRQALELGISTLEGGAPKDKTRLDGNPIQSAVENCRSFRCSADCPCSGRDLRL